ncbi:MAG: nitroreductase family protein [Candidatus Nezhaarchaeota archaeon]|nr:nitroreductase family protein [Candidatus Nezhaarchaeota archaeon]
MDVVEAIKTRRSIRSYFTSMISDSELEALLELASWAPSAGNLQPWEFVIVRDEKIKERLAAEALHQWWITEAPVVVVACANERRSSSIYGVRGRSLYCICDVSAAVENLLLAAHASGLGSCWVGAFHDEGVARLLKLPSGVRPIAILPIGRPAEHPAPPPRRPLSEVLHFDQF